MGIFQIFYFLVCFVIGYCLKGIARELDTSARGRNEVLGDRGGGRATVTLALLAVSLGLFCVEK